MAANTSLDRSLDTLAIDIGGTGLKASVLDATGQMEHARVRCDTPYPLSPQKLLLELQSLIAELPPFDRVSVGFPGMVRAGQVLSAPHFVSPDGPGGTPAPKLVRAWHRFDLAAALQELTGKPTKVANDADLQGAAVVEGKGFELVITLGTGVGTAFFSDGQLLPHLEFAHHPLRKGLSYNDVLGEAARRKAGTKKWRGRVMDAVETLRALCFFDHCYIGGGNSARLGSELPEGVSLVDNSAGILGGIKLWQVTAGHGGEVANSKARPATARKAPPAKNPVPARRTNHSPAPARTRPRRPPAGG
jgi:polyphosphate glucokinase